MIYFPFTYASARFGYLKPAKISDTFVGEIYGLGNCVLNRLRGGSSNFDLFIHRIFHNVLFLGASQRFRAG